MVTLRVRLTVRDYDMWHAAFDKDAGGREAHGCTGYRIFRLVENDNRVELDMDFANALQAETFLGVLRHEVWPSSDKAPAKLGTPETSILQIMESHSY
jgi:hypothetical protein